jgi:DNA-binding transcriptional LysR family regulator
VLGQQRPAGAAASAVSQRLALAVYPEHPLANKKTLRFEQTLDHDHDGLQPSTAMHTMLQRAAARVGKSLSYRAVVSNFDASFRVNAAYLAISVISVEVGKPYTEMLGVALIPLSDTWAQRSFAVRHRDLNALQTPVRRMVDHLIERARASVASKAMP